MHAVKCTNCGKRLKISRPVHNARLRCPVCDNVWVGDSETVPDLSGSGAPAPPTGAEGAPHRRPAHEHDAQHQGGYHRRRKTINTWVLVVLVGVGVVGITVFGVLGYYYHMHPRVVVKTKDEGEVLSDHRMRRDRAEEMREKSEQKSRRFEGLTQQPTGARQPAGGGEPDNKAQIYTEKARPLTDSQDQQNPSVSVELASGGIGTGGAGKNWITGWIINSGRHTVVSATATVSIYDAGGSPLGRASSNLCRFIPPGARVPFSIPSPVGRDADVGEINAAAESVKVSPQVTCVRIDPVFIDVVRNSTRTMTLTGEVSYPHGHTITEARVYCDFFTSKGVHAGAAWGDLKDSRGNEITTLAGRQNARFEVSFTPKKGYVTDIIQQWSARLVGIKSD